MFNERLSGLEKYGEAAKKVAKAIPLLALVLIIPADQPPSPHAPFYNPRSYVKADCPPTFTPGTAVTEVFGEEVPHPVCIQPPY